ncbi:unnamed protein product [Adineta steineri]|uniref:Uncharacterized protein n=1 Tax=Adineta steineri TaxID=433720 RepID=A0A814PCQ0_9BILA|nr:unnamed protein product [Adineta steineri]CAF3842813.1 unnamed protein product [Adineta steineri]
MNSVSNAPLNFNRRRSVRKRLHFEQKIETQESHRSAPSQKERSYNANNSNDSIKHVEQELNDSKWSKRLRSEQKTKTPEYHTPVSSQKGESYDANNSNNPIKRVEQELKDSRRRKQQALCVELSSFLFDIFGQRVIMQALPDKHDWFFYVRDILHRAYMKKELLENEKKLIEKVEQEAIPKYFTSHQWRCLLNLNVSMGEPCGHRLMDPDKLSEEVKNLASEWLEGDARQTVEALIKAMENSK